MDLKQQILHYYRVDELSLREIARRTETDRKTVTRLINAYEQAIKENPETGIEDFLASRPKYKSRKSTPRVVMDDISKEIDKWLKENDRRRNNGMRKQCLKCTDIHRELVNKGMNISYSSVCKYVHRKKTEKSPKPKDVYLRIHREPGEECEFDWGEVKLFIGKQKVSLMMAVFCLPYSTLRYAYLFHRQDTLAFMESHRNFFRDIHGVPAMMVYDNMRVAVKSFVGGDKKPTEALMKMSGFYCFEYRFCNVRAGWEKGHVERSVEYVRRKAFCLTDHFNDIRSAQEHLNRMCTQVNNEQGSLSTAEKSSRLEADLSSLKPFPGNLGCFEVNEYIVDKWSTVSMKNVHYSVPDSLVGEKVHVKVYSEKIVILYGKEKVASHQRSYCGGDWCIKLEHYLRTLSRKPGALPHSVVWQRAPEELKRLYDSYFKNDNRAFVLLLDYAWENGFSGTDIIRACRELTGRGVRKISPEQVKAMLHGNAQEEMEESMESPVLPAQQENIEREAVDMLEGITALMTGYNEAHDIIPTI